VSLNSIQLYPEIICFNKNINGALSVRCWLSLRQKLPLQLLLVGTGLLQLQLVKHALIIDETFEGVLVSQLQFVQVAHLSFECARVYGQSFALLAPAGLEIDSPPLRHTHFPTLPQPALNIALLPQNTHFLRLSVTVVLVLYAPELFLQDLSSVPESGFGSGGGLFVGSALWVGEVVVDAVE
jgi:hypothetical protein